VWETTPPFFVFGSRMADAIENALTTPKSATTPAGSVVARDAADLIAADRYTAAKAAQSKPTRGVIFQKLIPAAAVPDQQGTIANTAGAFDQPG